MAILDKFVKTGENEVTFGILQFFSITISVGRSNPEVPMAAEGPNKNTTND